MKFVASLTDHSVGKDIFLCFCPERIAQGLAHSELRTLPQICGAEDNESLNTAAELFEKLAPKIMKTNFITAELVKLLENTFRSVNIGMANEMALICDKLDVDVWEVMCTLRPWLLLNVSWQLLQENGLAVL